MHTSRIPAIVPRGVGPFLSPTRGPESPVSGYAISHGEGRGHRLSPALSGLQPTQKLPCVFSLGAQRRRGEPRAFFCMRTTAVFYSIQALNSPPLGVFLFPAKRLRRHPKGTYPSGDLHHVQSVSGGLCAVVIHTTTKNTFVFFEMSEVE